LSIVGTLEAVEQPTATLGALEGEAVCCGGPSLCRNAVNACSYSVASVAMSQVGIATSGQVRSSHFRDKACIWSEMPQRKELLGGVHLALGYTECSTSYSPAMPPVAKAGEVPSTVNLRIPCHLPSSSAFASCHRTYRELTLPVTSYSCSRDKFHFQVCVLEDRRRPGFARRGCRGPASHV